MTELKVSSSGRAPDRITARRGMQLRTHQVSLVLAGFYPVATIAMVLELYYQINLAIDSDR